MAARQHHWCVWTIASVILLVAGCARFDPRPLVPPPYVTRAAAQEQAGVRISAAVLSASEAEQEFDLPLAKSGIQPVWLKIENHSAQEYWLVLPSVDPNYFAADEIAYLHATTFDSALNRRMADYLRTRRIDLLSRPGQVTEGFVYANRDEGLKYVPVVLSGHGNSLNFGFSFIIPDAPFDWQPVDRAQLYPPQALRDLNEQQLRAWLEQLPCCVSNEAGTQAGDPVNLVVIGSLPAVRTAFAAANWDMTERVTIGSAAQMTESFLFDTSDRYSPVSPLYLFSRKQDMALQKARHTINQRIHLRLWLAPITCAGEPVLVGQISRDIGVRFTEHSPTLTTHKIDPEVDEARDYLFSDLGLGGYLARVAFVTGVGETPASRPRPNLTGDPWYSDGLRVVLFVGEQRRALQDLEFLRWERFTWQ
jgi:hypothetical protein